MPSLQPYLIEPIWEQFMSLLPQRETNHPLGCHRSRIPDRVVFEKLVQVLVFGCAYERIVGRSCSATTLRPRRDEWIEAVVMARLRELALEAYDKIIGLELSEGLSTAALPKLLAAVRRQAETRQTGGNGASNAPRSQMPKAYLQELQRPSQSPRLSALLEETLDTLDELGRIPEQMSMHLDRGYDSELTRKRLEGRSLIGVTSEKGEAAPLQATKHWVVERTNSWQNSHKKLL